MRPFTEKEDELIRFLYDEQKIKNWGIVANTLTQQYQFPRNARQCRDRYKIFIDTSMQPQWTQQQQLALYEFHNRIGNKWAYMAKKFPGKTDNCLKNHFYSKLRKALRHLNKVIKKRYKKQFKQLKIGYIYKIIEGFQEQFRQRPFVDQDVSNYCARLKNMLLIYVDRQVDESIDADFEDEKKLIQQIIDFNKNYRKKTKKQKKQSLEVSHLFRPHKSINIQAQSQDKDDDQQSQFQKILSDQSDNEEENRPIKDIQSSTNNNKNKNQMLQEKQEIQLRKSPKIFVLVEDEEIRLSNQSKKSGQMECEDNLILSGGRMSSEDENYNKRFCKDLRWSGSISNQNKCSTLNIITSQPDKFPFGFMRGQSSFRSYKSQSNPSDIDRVDMFTDDIRISGKLKQEMRMQEQRDNDLFRSHK